MQYYSELVLPRIIELACGSKRLVDWRKLATDQLFGRVAEIGFGSGANFGLYPSSVSKVIAVEPSRVAMRIFDKKMARQNIQSEVDIVRLRASAIALPLKDASFDCVLLSFVLCSVGDSATAMAEIKRILAPNGKVVFVEHGLAPTLGVQKVQFAFNRTEQRVAGGCQLVLDAKLIISNAGFEVSVIKTGYGPGPRPWGYMTVGVGVLS